uniref:Uncharacterized protein LOC111109879 isoform X2 n=1 Tax=Crassostrea virginica TaxID=6565 RepID=A0A8B8BEP4_CRAVI|nr:uncharacterized protein LOC111109879 isoform X2 [Crassostrea virginica]
MWALTMYPINYQVILTLLCGWCTECLNHGNERDDQTGSKDNQTGNTRWETIVSVSAAWNSERDRERSTNFWKCINDMHCTVQVNAIEQSNHVCMCTDGIANRLCTKIICSEKRSETSSVNMDCKYNLEFENASECSASGELGEVVKMERKQAAMRVNTMDVLTCSLSGEENACNSEASITISKISVMGKNFMLRLAYLDLQSNCNDSGNNVFMIHHKRSIFLCLFMYCKNICTLLMCNRESESDKLDQKARDYGHPRNNISLFEVWSQWKVEILLACSGIVLCAGVIGIIVGMFSYKLRERKRLLTRAKRKQYHASQDYVEIRESMYHDQEEILENIRVGMNQIEIPPETTNNLRSTPEESQSDDGYSNIYNVLQPNYGAKRHSYPSLGMKLPEA